MARRGSSAEAERVARERRQHKLAELHAQLTAGVNRLTSSEAWAAWLRVASRFHSYSFNNTLLIYAQRPDATRVAGYQVWRQLGRQVGKGEHGIQILAPVVRRRHSGDEPADEAPSAARRKQRRLETFGGWSGSASRTCSTSVRPAGNPSPNRSDRSSSSERHPRPCGISSQP